jgi:hypothetical protein
MSKAAVYRVWLAEPDCGDDENFDDHKYIAWVDEVYEAMQKLPNYIEHDYEDSVGI